MEEERIALYVDFENLAIGARDALGGMEFDFEPIANALAERGLPDYGHGTGHGR